MAENAPKGSDAKRDGVTTNAQSGTSTGVSKELKPEDLPSPSKLGTVQPVGSPPLSGSTSSSNLTTTGETPADFKGEKQEDGTFKGTYETKEGDTVTVSAINEEEMRKNRSAGAGYVNLTQSLEGVPGNVDLTQGGMLNSDKSLRDTRDIEEINKEIEDKAGPNPRPNRDGNEMSKAGNVLSAGGPQLMQGIDNRTNKIAEDLRSLRGKTTLTQADKDKLEKIEKELRSIGRM